MNSIFNQIKRYQTIQFKEGESFSFTLPATEGISHNAEGSSRRFNNIDDNLFTNSDKMKTGGKYKVIVKQWMTEPSTPDFDFHDKWNEGNPMPLCIMEGEVISETPRMFKMSLSGKAEPASFCSVCGKPLSNPVSKLYGIGPECSVKVGLDRIQSEEEAQKMWNDLVSKIGNIKWTGWVTKSAIKEWKVL